MNYTCPYDHHHLPLPMGIQDSLETGLLELLTGTSTSVGTDEVSRVLLGPILTLVEPWAPLFRPVLERRSVLAQRIAHQILEFLAQLLADGGLEEVLAGALGRLGQQDPRLLPEFAALGLESRVRLTSEYRGAVERSAGEVARGMIRLGRRGLPRFLDELLVSATKYQETEDRVRTALGTSSGLWDLEPGLWQTREGVQLQATATFLSTEPSVAAMLDTLGRRALNDPRFTRAPASVPRAEVALGRQEIIGIEQGRDLEGVVPSSLATLASPRSRSLFLSEYSEGRLSQYAFRTRRAAGDSTSSGGRVQKEAELGPFILCIDTSGSMDGLPEQVAKALSLAAVFRAREQGRPLVIISFSQETKVIEWQEQRSLKEYLDFLGRSFRGGTDLRPALEQSLHYLQTGAFQDADLLIVSDFRIPKIIVKKSYKFTRLQAELGTRIHALTVGRDPIVDDYNMFDSRWIFFSQASPLESRLQESG